MERKEKKLSISNRLIWMLEWRCLTTVRFSIEMRLETIVNGEKKVNQSRIYAPKDKQIKGTNA